MGDGAQKSPAEAGPYLFTLSLWERTGVRASPRSGLAVQCRTIADGDTLRSQRFGHVTGQIDM